MLRFEYSMFTNSPQGKHGKGDMWSFSQNAGFISRRRKRAQLRCRGVMRFPDASPRRCARAQQSIALDCHNVVASSRAQFKTQLRGRSKSLPKFANQDSASRYR